MSAIPDNNFGSNLAKDFVVALIESSSEENSLEYDVHVREEQRQLCSDLLQCLPVDSQVVNVRELLGNLPGSHISRLPVILADLITNRVEVMDLLPATQDERANAEVMFSSTSAMTISALAMISGTLYASLLGMPGGLGCGLIHVGCLSGLSALVRRWSVECRGREPGTRKNSKSSAKRGAPERKKKVVKKKKANTPPKKRKRGTRRSARLDVESSEEEDPIEMATIHEENEDVEEEEHEADPNFSVLNEFLEKGTNDEDSFISDGLKLALALSKALFLPEFRSWSIEAQEAHIDAATAALACASALSVSISDDSESGKSVNDSCLEVVNSISCGLKCCIGRNSKTSESGNSPMAQDEIMSELVGDAVETIKSKNIVFILRGLFPLLSFQAELPNGHKGRQAAFNAAGELFQELVGVFSADILDNAQKFTSDTSNSSSKREFAYNTQKGGLRSARRSLSPSRRRSLSGTPGNRSRNEENAVIPSLKKSVTPKTIRFQRMSLGSKNTETKVRPRSMLSAIVGLLQKVATLSDLNKAESRSRALSLIKRSLAVFPEIERSYFLRFVSQLSYSKRATHRIFAVDLIGSVLAEEWLWLYHCANEPFPFFKPSDNNDEQQILQSSIWISGIGNRDAKRCPPLALLVALHGRIGDAAPAVRARAIYSLSTLIASTRSNGAASTSRPFSQPARSALYSTVDALSDTLKKALIKRASSDERAAVRAASIVGLKNVLLLECDRVSTNNMLSPLSRKDIIVLTNLCSDSSVSVRRAAAESITSLLLECSSRGPCDVITDLLEESWVNVVLAQVADEEATCATSAVQMFIQIVVNPIIIKEGSGKKTEHHCRFDSAWRILARASERDANSAGANSGSLRIAFFKVLQSEGNASSSICYQLLNEMNAVALKSLNIYRIAGAGTNVNTDGDELLFEDAIDSKRRGVWCAFDALADCFTMASGIKQKGAGMAFSLEKAAKAAKLNGDFFVRCWNKLKFLLMNPATPDQFRRSVGLCCRSCLRMISDIGTIIPIDEARCAKDGLQELLFSQQLSTDLISCAIRAVVTLTKHVAENSGSSPASVADACREFLSELQCRSTSSLDSFFVSGPAWRSKQHDLVETLERAIFTVGEVVLFGFSADEDEASLIMKKRGLELNLFPNDPIRGMYIKPSTRLVERIEALLPYSLPSMTANDAIPTPSNIRAISIVTLGKFCLRDEALAKASINLLLQEIRNVEGDDRKENAIIQSNALLVLGDLCVRYTNLVDRHLPAMAACLQARSFSDSEEQLHEFQMVRTHAVLVLSSLLLQDYIKWRGLLFHRFLVATVDTCTTVAQISKAILCGPLLSKQPNLFHNNFAESIFVLNDCVAHPLYAAAANAGENGAGVVVGFDNIQLFGSECSIKRHHIYSMMLSQLTDEDKIGVTARLTKEVLGGALKNGDLNVVCKLSAEAFVGIKESMSASESHRIESAINVLKDTFAVLTSPLCQVGCERSPDSVEGADDDCSLNNGNGSSLINLAAVKGRLLKKISRKHMCEVVVPILCNLKSILEDSRSPLLKDLLMYLVYVYRRYKEEVKELLVSNPVLLQEIEYDTRQFEKNRRESQTTTRIVVPQDVAPHPIFHL